MFFTYLMKICKLVPEQIKYLKWTQCYLKCNPRQKTNILLYLYQNLGMCNILGFRIPLRKLQGFKTD